MADREEMISRYQERGSDDHSNGDFRPPLNLITEIGASDLQRDCNKAYLDSWRNHREQTK